MLPLQLISSYQQLDNWLKKFLKLEQPSLTSYDKPGPTHHCMVPTLKELIMSSWVHILENRKERGK